jgi:uncharacterized protein YbjQ (UPF0145 family)
MSNPKNVLVVTTSSLDGIKISKYLKPVSAHVVAGTNLFSDFLGGLTDFFGGRSKTYQKQISSIYNEAIERLKYAAYEIGANCIVGLKIDLDEISGKGKSMFMLTAVGTAVITENELLKKDSLAQSQEKLESVGAESVNILRRKKEIIKEAELDSLELNDEIWDFITINEVDEVFPFLIKQYSSFANSNKLLATYLDGLSNHKKLNLLYEALAGANESIALKLCEIIKELKLFDYSHTEGLLKSSNLQTKKYGLLIVTYDKPTYEFQDIQDLQTLKSLIQETFFEIGERTTKKQLLSSKEKEVWICECGKTNEIGVHCYNCQQDIYGFTKDEVKPSMVIDHINQKVELITELLK